MGNETDECHSWIDIQSIQEASIEELNNIHIPRYLGGICLLCLVVVLGLIGNIHVFLVYLRKSFNPSNYRIYVLWLASLDIFNCAVVAPLVIQYQLQSMTYPSNILCKIFRFLLYFTAVASTSSLVVIAIDRHRRVTNPLANQLSHKHAKLLCLVSFAVGVVLSWPAIFLYELTEVNSGVEGLAGNRCFFTSEVKAFQFFFNVILIAFFFIVSLTLIIVYLRIGREINRQQRFRDSVRRPSLRPLERNTRPRLNSTITLRTVTIAYILCALPHHALVIPILAMPNFDCILSLPAAVLYYTFIWTYFINSVLNPFIYGIKDPKFRSALKSVYSKNKTEKTVSRMISYIHDVNGNTEEQTAVKQRRGSANNGNCLHNENVEEQSESHKSQQHNADYKEQEQKQRSVSVQTVNMLNILHISSKMMTSLK
ncbi:hypothetical protein FSP39_023790 [Pinctada imbricata]|uniref:G-protein coupled receptors family 1 profile domain-containing protein n=1 Tax=Pinctada imbricata TaxID=66713 RepID=A0AA88XNR0_PINIB|nr:hypothetical protein FSP39_023790 [Pinctada imbricata]